MSKCRIKFSKGLKQLLILNCSSSLSEIKRRLENYGHLFVVCRQNCGHCISLPFKERGESEFPNPTTWKVWLMNFKQTPVTLLSSLPMQKTSSLILISLWWRCLFNRPIVKSLLLHINEELFLAIVRMVISPAETQDQPEWANLIRWAWSERSFLAGQTRITGRGLGLSPAERASILQIQQIHI